MEKQKLISVIVPIYKVEKYIHKCIDSILNQTYKNLEIILVDDGSPDACPQICDAYARQDERIKVIHQENAGLSAARNAGLDVAQGEYICFVDSDDYIDKYMIEKLSESAIKMNADLVLCNYVYVDENGKKFKGKYEKKLEQKVFDSKEVFIQASESIGEVFIVAWNKLYKRQLWEHYRYPVGRIHEDEFAFHHIICQCKIIASIDYVGYYYVQRTGSIMSTPSLKSCMDGLDAFKQRFDWYAKINQILLGKKLFSLWYLRCAELYQAEKNQLILKRYLKYAANYQKMIYGTKVPLKYDITNRGLWYLPGVFTKLLQLYKKAYENFKK